MILILMLLVITGSVKADYHFENIKKISIQQKSFDTIEWKNLLHYEDNQSVINKESPFFLSIHGYKDPESEYLATLKGFFDNPEKADNHIICRYPARFDYILRHLKLNHKEFPEPKCTLYKEYQSKVATDNVIIVFASENTTSPSSMMGHSFLKLSGQVNGKLKEHAFSYFARTDSSQNLSFYINAITSGANGIYILSSYQQKEQRYLNEETRSLWEFELKMTTSEKQRLKRHLWELKEKDIKYSFISHNCNTALMSILKTANQNLEVKTAKPFTTPVEYIQKLHRSNYISDISIIPTPYIAKKIIQHRLGNILEAPKSSRVSLSYEHYSNDYLNLELSPVYQDIRDISNAYSDELESKIMELDMGINISSNKLFVRSIDILRMKSILDYSLTHELSKSIALSFEDNLGSEKSELRPTMEFGMGYGYYIGNITAYFMPKIGYRYNDYSNFYIAPEIGIISEINKKIKIITSYTPYLSSNDNNRGYNSELQLYTGYAIGNDNEIFAKYSHYTNAITADQVSTGFTHHF